MTESKGPEYWLCGALPDTPPLLQPVAHALLQAKREVNTIMNGFPDILLWESPAHMASPAFHLQHLTGVLDRLFTYARGAALSSTQLDALAGEGAAFQQEEPLHFLLASFNEKVNECIEELKGIDQRLLTETRLVGRQQLPSTVAGLLFHAAEHTMRHVGQLLVTAGVLKSGQLKNG